MSKRNPIAVVGLSGIFPGAPDIDTLWRHITHKYDACAPIAPQRWIASGDYICNKSPQPDRAFHNRACLIDTFNPDLDGINLPSDSVQELDPLYQIVLSAGHVVLNDCITRDIAPARKKVVLAAIALPTDGASKTARRVLGRALKARLFGNGAPETPCDLSLTDGLSTRVTGLPATLLAQAFNLQGGGFTLDAACASSLYAVKLACDELQNHRADLLIAGGVSRPDCLYTQVGFSQLRALSRTGRCAPFDQNADGLVVGEGIGLLALKRLDDAVAAGDRIYGVIRGIGLSNDIGGSLLAPANEGQLRAMRQAYADAGWQPRDVDLIECHGAGTPVGDKTELNSLLQLWGADGWETGQCALGSIKSMIGHLLTAAGAAGMIKTLLALKHAVLPPSLNFTRTPDGIDLSRSPFRIQTETASWESPAVRRAAVSAFGFGGINAHLLFESWQPSAKQTSAPATQPARIEIQSVAEPVAIVGMQTHFGTLANLKTFKEAIFNGQPIFAKRPANRWHGGEIAVAPHLGPDMHGAFIDRFEPAVDRFRIPPKELPDILPQQLLMLDVAADALQDAGLPQRLDRPRMGAIIGIEFDQEATHFHLRWQLPRLIDAWAGERDLSLTATEKAQWLETLQAACGPPLTPERTLGALGGIVASRVAKEFGLGGPSFVVSDHAGSGLRALEVALRFLQQNETDAMLVGAVDLCGDIRHLIAEHQITPFTSDSTVKPFDHNATGTLPGEGAVALVLRRLDQAVADQDRIYGVVKGVGAAHTGAKAKRVSPSAYIRSMQAALQEAGTHPSDLGYIEAHGSGHPDEDAVESRALTQIFDDCKTDHPGCAVGSAKAVIGHAGASAGLAGLAKTALCLYHRILPPLPNYEAPSSDVWSTLPVHLPHQAHYWAHDRIDGPRRAAVAAFSPDGACRHVILEEYFQAQQNTPQNTAAKTLSKRLRAERALPLGEPAQGLFRVAADTPHDLVKMLEAFKKHVQETHRKSLGIARAAFEWHARTGQSDNSKQIMALLATNHKELFRDIDSAIQQIESQTESRIDTRCNIAYTPAPLGVQGDTALVYPGSGNHFLGMGRQLATHFPHILRRMDAQTDRLRSQLRPRCYLPQRQNWRPGWEKAANAKIASDPLNMIFGQVIFGSHMTAILQSMGIRPQAAIGYSLGETAGYFALGAWPDRDQMLERMQTTDLFDTQLAGPCLAARRAWQIPASEPFEWRVAVVNRSAGVVRDVTTPLPAVELLIVNTPHECVIGGHGPQVQKAVATLACEAFYLDGVVTVHCDAARPVADAYRRLHLFPTRQPDGIRFYSCALAHSRPLTDDAAADSILRQALRGFDYPATIRQAYQDGVRVFIETGPHASCTRMIRSILDDQPHLALSASQKGENEYLTILKLLGNLTAHHVPVDLDGLYAGFSKDNDVLNDIKSSKTFTCAVGGPAPRPQWPRIAPLELESAPAEISPLAQPANTPLPQHAPAQTTDHTTGRTPAATMSEFIRTLRANTEATGKTHATYLGMADELTHNYGQTFALQNRLIEALIASGHEPALENLQPHTTLASAKHPDPVQPATNRQVAFDRDLCMEFAIGSLAKVLGPDFAEVDHYPVRVRLPDEPLMLVDRIIRVTGAKGSLGAGTVVTEHDVLPGAWYLDGGRAPVCISVEAGQADLFLSSYLGIDLKVKGTRAYRLLDATVRFHGGLPQPGDVIRYDIAIDRFVRQGDTYLFFFRFEGYIGARHLITMHSGCAGFFTAEEVRNSGGIILTEDDTKPLPGERPADWRELVPMTRETYSAAQVDALRRGDPAGCFGNLFDGIRLPDALKLPGGRMKLLDRILDLDPAGGRYGLGSIRAEADIYPDDWFLTCHFMDDMVMPGTLMYECCAHTLRVFLLRMGWLTTNPDACYEPVVGVESVLKCRGPVTPQTRHVHYEVEIRALGYNPEPYVIADAHMYADGHRIVKFNDMAMKITGADRSAIESFWAARNRSRQPTASPSSDKKILFDHDRILAFSIGSPSEAFGAPYAPFDNHRIIARLPGPPYLFMDRIVHCEPPAWEVKPDGWVEAEHDICADAWYFRANRTARMPYCVLLEIALQPCGWLAAYAGTALKSDKDLKFRNLGGTATLHRQLDPTSGTLTMRTRMTKVSEAGEMIIEHFDMQILQNGRPVLSGDTYFGFFTTETLADQKGLRNFEPRVFEPAPTDLTPGAAFSPTITAPLTPEDTDCEPAPALTLPSKALLMIDRVDVYLPSGGPHGLGYIRGGKQIDPEEWFFKAHFYQDPVCPGSLGVESFLQLLKMFALKRWPDLENACIFEWLTGIPHHWEYRGQIIPSNQHVEVEAMITRIQEQPIPEIQADGFVKVDGLFIYDLRDFGIRLAPAGDAP